MTGKPESLDPAGDRSPRSRPPLRARLAPSSGSSAGRRAIRSPPPWRRRCAGTASTKRGGGRSSPASSARTTSGSTAGDEPRVAGAMTAPVVVLAGLRRASCWCRSHSCWRVRPRASRGRNPETCRRSRRTCSASSRRSSGCTCAPPRTARPRRGSAPAASAPASSSTPAATRVTVSYVRPRRARASRRAAVTGARVPAQAGGRRSRHRPGVVKLEGDGPWPAATLVPSGDVAVGASNGHRRRRRGQRPRARDQHVHAVQRFSAFWEYMLDRAIIAGAGDPAVGRQRRRQRAGRA